MKQSVRDRIYAGNHVAEWNAKHGVGQKATLRRNDGTLFHTTTRSEAQVSASGRAVIFLEGITLWCLLARVEAEE